MQAEPTTPDTSKPRRTFDADTVRVETHGTHYAYNPAPAVNVKVRHGFESLKPEDWESIRANVRDYEAGLAPETVARFGRDYCERFESERSESFYSVWYSEACSQGFEQAEELARELFGADVEVGSTGRSGGWLYVKGLPDVEDWSPAAPSECEGCGAKVGSECTLEGFARKCSACAWTHGCGSLPSLKGSSIEGARFEDGTVLDLEAGLFERWAFFVEACEALAAETPFRCADLLAVNVFAREETLREVEYLRALDGGRWDTVRFSVPNRVEDSDALVAYLEEHAPERVPDFAHVFVLRDPAPKVTPEELEAD